MFGETSMSANGTTPMIDIIRAEAQSCMTATVGINLENKIVVAIAIRMAAEEFMVKKINDPVFWATIKSKQTQVLLGKFKKHFAKEIESIAILDRVPYDAREHPFEFIHV